MCFCARSQAVIADKQFGRKKEERKRAAEHKRIETEMGKRRDEQKCL